MDTLAKETVLQIDDTVFIIECETSKSSTETAYDKVKKLILNHVNSTVILYYPKKGVPLEGCQRKENNYE